MVGAGKFAQLLRQMHLVVGKHGCEMLPARFVNLSNWPQSLGSKQKSKPALLALVAARQHLHTPLCKACHIQRLFFSAIRAAQILWLPVPVWVPGSEGFSTVDLSKTSL